jgi:hypothetical protein
MDPNHVYFLQKLSMQYLVLNLCVPLFILFISSYKISHHFPMSRIIDII